MPGQTGQAPAYGMQVDVRFGPISLFWLPIAKACAKDPGVKESVGRL